MEKITKKFILKIFKNFIKRCKKIIELKIEHLESIYLKQIRKEMDVEEKEEKEINQEDKKEKEEKEKEGQEEQKKSKIKNYFQ